MRNNPVFWIALTIICGLVVLGVVGIVAVSCKSDDADSRTAMEYAPPDVGSSQGSR